MIRLSVNILTSSISLLSRLSNYTSLTNLVYSRITSISIEDVFDFASRCGWACMHNETPILTDRGRDILQLYEHCELYKVLRQMLNDYILKVSPIWSKRIPYGRGEAAIFMTEDERACFSKAKLLLEVLDPSIVAWWDTLADHVRHQASKNLIDIGRLGEENTIRYERRRTLYEPKWMSIDSNMAGYDIQSRIEKENPSELLIEVKTTRQTINEAWFHISAHEWSVACTSSAYVFHLWCFSEGKKYLAIINANEMKPFIPVNSQDGEWENVKIPYASFKDKYFEIVE